MTNYNRTLTSAWRGNLAVVEECIFWINAMRAGKARGILSDRIRMYKEAVRRVSECEAEMIELGIPFRRRVG